MVRKIYQSLGFEYFDTLGGMLQRSPREWPTLTLTLLRLLQRVEAQGTRQVTNSMLRDCVSASRLVIAMSKVPLDRTSRCASGRDSDSGDISGGEVVIILILRAFSNDTPFPRELQCHLRRLSSAYSLFVVVVGVYRIRVYPLH